MEEQHVALRAAGEMPKNRPAFFSRADAKGARVPVH